MLPKIILLVLFIVYKDVTAQDQAKCYVELVSAGFIAGDPEIFKIEIHHVDGVKCLKLEVNFPWEMDETVALNVTMEGVKYGMRQMYMQQYGANACELLRKFLGLVWEKASIALDMGTGCPKPQGHFETNCFEFNADDLHPPSFASGIYILTISLDKDGAMVTKFEIEITNDRPGMGGY